MIDEIEHKLGPLARESADLALEHLPVDQLAFCESPVEKLFLVALWMRGVWPGWIQLAHARTFDALTEQARDDMSGGHAAPQIKIGPYRVDFLLAMHFGAHEPLGLVAVECDGHEFHEKTKAQAARDKARDRDLQMRGIQVFRYTGSEIWADAGECAAEVVGHLISGWCDASHRRMERLTKEFGSVQNYVAHMSSKKVDE
jgi:very-short-patch-repair endonuclease